MSLATRIVIAELDSPIDDSDWTLVELEGQGPGVCAHFDADTLVPGHLERLIARRDPLLAPIVEHGVDDDGAYIIWEGAHEETLATLSGPLSMGEISLLADVLLAGLERLHNAGFIHPCLDASVVRLSVDADGRAVPEVIGFGMPAPEGRSARDDLRDVGVLLYRLYTGREPYEPGQPSDGSVTATSFANARPGVTAPVAFEGAVMRAIGPADQRFVNAAEFRAHLTSSQLRRSGFSTRAVVTTDPSMRRALTNGVSGLEALLTPELVPGAEQKRREVPIRRRLSLAPAVALAALALIIGFGIGRLTTAERASAAVLDGSGAALRPLATVATTPTITAPRARLLSAEPATPEAVDAKPAGAEAVAPVAPVAVGTTKLTVVSDPPGANVLMRKQKRMEKTPFTMDVTADMLPLELVFDKRTHHPRREFVEKLEGPEMTVTVRMKKRD